MNLIDKIKLGDNDAFNEAFNLYHRKLYYYVLSKTQSEFQAEETVQITFIKLWDYRNNLNADLPLSAHVFRIGKTVLIDQLRKVNTLDNMLSQVQESLSDRELNAGPANLFKQEVMQQLQTALEQMPPIRKRVFELSRFEHLSHKEIASRLSITSKTVENHITLALKHARKYFLMLVVLVTYSLY